VLPETKYQKGNVEYIPVAGTESASSVIDGIKLQLGSYMYVANVF
jgi:hypothetical protein